MLIIKSKGEVREGEVVRRMAGKIRAKEIDGAPKAVRENRKGEVIVVARDERQRDKIKERIQDLGGLKVREK